MHELEIVEIDVTMPKRLKSKIDFLVGKKWGKTFSSSVDKQAEHRSAIKSESQTNV